MRTITNDGKGYFDLTPQERKDRAKLTPKELEAVERVSLAIRGLPKSLHIDLRGGEFTVSKRLTKGSSQVVLTINRKSLAL